jgi:uncharacterized membrane protein HdeD (DUF308 family)
MAQSQASTKGRYFLRLLALASTTICGVYFLASVFVLVAAYNHTERHFPLFITKKDFAQTIVVGVGFVCSGIVYIVLARKTKTNPA